MQFSTKVKYILPYSDIIHEQILNTRIGQVLAQATQSHAVAPVADGVLDVNIVASGFDGGAIVTTLVDEIG